MNIILLTKFYPYGTGEAFIENEISTLASYYKTVTIVVCEAPKNSTIRPLPKNVKLFTVYKNGKYIDFIKDALSGLRYIFKPTVELKKEYKFCKGILQRLFLWYFESKSRRIYDAIEKTGALNELSKEPFVLYSYWLFATARVGVYIKNCTPPVYMFSRAHRYDLYSDINRTNYLPYRELFLREYDNIFPCSSHGEKYLQNKVPQYKEKVSASLLGTIDHGVGASNTSNKFAIVSCSRLEPVKRVERIVEALALLEEQATEIEWTHIGGGAEFDKLQQMAKDKLKSVKYNFLGNIPNKSVYELYKTTPYDLFVNVSSSEGLPVSIMEAISFGIPVIGTNVGGTSEIVIPKLTGSLIPEKFTNQELANEILFYVEAKKQNSYPKIQKQCREYWLKNFQAINNYKNLYDLINEKIDKLLM